MGIVPVVVRYGTMETAMRRKATTEELLTAYRKVLQAGDRDPSQNTIRELIGGSKSTIQALFVENAASLAAMRDESLHLPSDFRDAGKTFVHGLWRAAEREARIQMEGHRDIYEREHDKLRDELGKHIEAAEALADAYETQTHELDEVRKELGWTQEALRRAEAERLEAVEQVARLRGSERTQLEIRASLEDLIEAKVRSAMRRKSRAEEAGNSHAMPMQAHLEEFIDQQIEHDRATAEDWQPPRRAHA